MNEDEKIQKREPSVVSTSHKENTNILNHTKSKSGSMQSIKDLSHKFNVKTASSYEMGESGSFENLYRTLLKSYKSLKTKYDGKKKQVRSLKDTIRGQFVKEKLHLENE